MIPGAIRRLMMLGAILVLPVAASAQEAVLTGTVTDSTGAVLPGVTVTRRERGDRQQLHGVTDERGIYRIPVRVGAYQITAELQGFTTVNARWRRSCWSARRRRSTCRWRRRPSQETVTVTAEAPLLRTDDVEPRRQHRSAPGAGAAGERPQLDGAGAAGAGQPHAARRNAITPLPDRNGGEAREFQLNVDGQQVSAEIGTGGQPKLQPGLDRRVPVPLEPLRRDAGPVDRRAGERDHQVGQRTSCPGLFRGNFRDSQVQRGEPGPRTASCRSTTSSSARRFGGPIVRDKLHYFGNYEYEREPRSSIWNTPYPVVQRRDWPATTTRRRAACAWTTSCRRRRG